MTTKYLLNQILKNRLDKFQKTPFPKPKKKQSSLKGINKKNKSQQLERLNSEQRSLLNIENSYRDRNWIFYQPYTQFETHFKERLQDSFFDER